MYIGQCQYVRMKRRTTIEIDDALLERARKALGSTTTGIPQGLTLSCGPRRPRIGRNVAVTGWILDKSATVHAVDPSVRKELAGISLTEHSAYKGI
jgi:hypothetical protein